MIWSFGNSPLNLTFFGDFNSRCDAFVFIQTSITLAAASVPPCENQQGINEFINSHHNCTINMWKLEAVIDIFLTDTDQLLVNITAVYLIVLNSFRKLLVLHSFTHIWFFFFFVNTYLTKTNCVVCDG